MKKVGIYVLIFLCLILVGCSKDKKEKKEENKQLIEIQKELKIVYKDINVTPGTEFDIDNFDDEYEKFDYSDEESENEVEEVVYSFEDIEITVIDKNDKKIINSVFIKNNKVSTNEGIKIGSSKDEMEKLYGKMEEKSSDVTYSSNEVDVTFTLNKNEITNITYSLKK